MRPVAFCAALIVTLSAPSAFAGPPASKVFLNGVPAPVYFNDGDSFRVLSGRFQGSKGRLAGYNTLESYGPVHQWGTWTYKEMSVLAKMATLNAQRGVWHCTSDLKTDTYGRTLWWCEDLAADQVRKGLAHAMSVTSEPAKAVLIEAQKEAIAAKRGIWAHGVPDYVLTSTHATSEDAEGRGTYNRLVSSVDGHSLKWKHDNDYPECTVVCDAGVDTDARQLAVVTKLAAEPTFAPIAASYDTTRLLKITNAASQGASIQPYLVAPEHGAILGPLLDGYKAAGELGRNVTGAKACVRHVDFKRRFGGGRAECLK